MSEWKTGTAYITKKTTSGTDILDITSDVENVVKKSGVSTGRVLVFVPGSTGAVTTIEYEPGVVSDLKRAVSRAVPEDIPYEHDKRWGDGNGYSHVRAALVGPSLDVPVSNGNLVLGTWQQIVLCDFDNKPRIRKVLVQVTGE